MSGIWDMIHKYRVISDSMIEHSVLTILVTWLVMLSDKAPSQVEKEHALQQRKARDHAASWRSSAR